ncbi:hypothetical protein [Pseudoduganella sp. GCM10020061]|uniref:hypothetical protein n=1 Tax=Pseudoduganella sp. GCM10020061 TaxID=3317345 RepID=UPI00362963FC
MSPRHIVLGLALLGAAGLAAFGDKEPEGAVVESVDRPAPAAAPAVARTPAPLAQEGPAVLRLVPRAELIGQAGDGDAPGFGARSWNPPPPEPPSPPPPAPPMAPAIPFTFIGKSLGEGRWEIYLAQGERIHAVRAGDVIDGAWRIDAVAPPMMTVTYLPLGQQQHMNIGANE